MTTQHPETDALDAASHRRVLSWPGRASDGAPGDAEQRTVSLDVIVLGSAAVATVGVTIASLATLGIR
ncbi:hypothetical protein ACFJGV_10595 [Cnuibacter sp. UC19_7]|uniref:hypothetical protein n=1 Tax=Cnuibacter sp. UC19_7 TaxID=3350166 RepID=UPI003670D110